MSLDAKLLPGVTGAGQTMAFGKTLLHRGRHVMYLHALL